ncbi:cadherin 74A [Haemaphysalis longicornis]
MTRTLSFVPHLIWRWLTIFLFIGKCQCQTNAPPEFLVGGNMEKFSLREDTPVGASVYTLRAIDPEHTRVSYYISGGTFSVNKDTGVVRLTRPLDREEESTVDVIISITDEKIQGQKANTVSLQREISILDYNDNPPIFENGPYTFHVDEDAQIGTTIYRNIVVTDADLGINADVEVTCQKHLTPVACDLFSLNQVRLGMGRFLQEIILRNSLDYEEQTTYVMSLLANDLAMENRMNSTADVIIKVNDVQDQPPVFVADSYSVTVAENSPEGTSVLVASAHDADAGFRRLLSFSLVNDTKGYFRLGKVDVDDNGVHHVVVETSDITIDREDEDIERSGGLYSFQLQAAEMVDGKPKGEVAVADVNIVITDTDDHVPEFNSHNFSVIISEDTPESSAIPGLNMVVNDNDVGENARFGLHLRDVNNSNGVFSVYPPSAVGRTPVLIKVADASRLDYEDENSRTFVFEVVASQHGFEVTSATVTVSLSDANDNGPMFENEQYLIQVPESARNGMTIFSLEARDADSGPFGKLSYSMKGYGSEKFVVEKDTGRIRIATCKNGCLDFESVPNYSFTYEAQDGGGKVSSVNLFIQVVDVNDNAPKFTKDSYLVDLVEDATKFSSPVFVKATDADGPSQGNGRVHYMIKATNLTHPEVISIDAESGELSLLGSLNVTAAPYGATRFEVIVQATDFGEPRLASETPLIIRLKRKNEGAPYFLNAPYKANVRENAKPGTTVLQLVATDPDGPDGNISYYIDSGARDNFVLNKLTGILSTSSNANLDRELNGDSYHILVYAVDGGAVPQKAFTTVTVSVQDVNNKPPVFAKDTYVHWVTESLPVGREVLNVTAVDPDVGAKVRYDIEEPITARDKTGSLVTSTITYNYKNAFRINGVTGQITVNSPLDYNAASVITFNVAAVDQNGALHPQKTTVEVTVYIQAHSESNPIFAPPWTPANPKIEITVPEESTVGSTIFTVTARDPLTHAAVTNFAKIFESDQGSFFSVSPISGAVTLNQRLDYEELPEKVLAFDVKAIIGQDKNSQKSSIATVIINVQDINDNSPVFSQNSYVTMVSEATQYPQTILLITATDKDTQQGYGVVRYFISGEGSDVFSINETTGALGIQEGAVLDRERQPLYNLQVTAVDNPGAPSNQRRTSVLVVIKIQDENDNPPEFSQSGYTAVVPENVPTGFSILTVRATDVDSGPNAEISYSFVDEPEMGAITLFAINDKTGIITVIQPLSGRGRSEPYFLTVRATDGGSPELHSDVKILIIIGDVSSNDGIPRFIRPRIGEIAYVHENVTIGASVFQVQAVDPDSALSSNGQVAYKFLDKHSAVGEDLEFEIDPASGFVSTTAVLDREKRDNYTLVVVAYDMGVPPQEAHQILRVVVLDVDDNEPEFERSRDAQPIVMKIKEEIPIGTIVGKVKAFDQDIGTNAFIDYYIVGGNMENVFSIQRTGNNEGEILTKKRVDREQKDRYLLTLQVSMPSKRLEQVDATYNPDDKTQLQVDVRVEDVDDNSPSFEKPSYVLGIRINSEINSELLTLKAKDPDSSSNMIMYSIRNVTYYRPSSKESMPVMGQFELDAHKGTLRSIRSLGKYRDGYFDITVECQSAPGPQNTAVTHVRAHILHDSDLMKFIFYKQPQEVRKVIPQFEKDLNQALASAVTANIYDTQYSTREDGSLDFDSASSCFQLLENGLVVSPDMVAKMLDMSSSQKVEALYHNYSIVGIEKCTPGRNPYKMKWTEICVLIVACLIAVMGFILTVILCFVRASYKAGLKRKLKQRGQRRLCEQTPAVSMISLPSHQRIYEWQESNRAPALDAMSFRSYPTMR